LTAAGGAALVWQRSQQASRQAEVKVMRSGAMRSPAQPCATSSSVI